MDTLKPLFARAFELASQRKFAQAAALYNKAVEIDPRSFAAWCNLAAMHLELGQTTEAANAARQAITLQPDFGPAWANLGDALRMMPSQGEASLQAYRRAAKLLPRSPDILNKLGATLQVRGDPAQAAGLLRDALALAPQHREARVNLTTALLSLQQYTEARAVLVEGSQLPNQSPEVRDEWRAALRLLDNNLRIQPLLAQAIARNEPAFISEAATYEVSVHREHKSLVETIAAALKGTDSLPTNFSAWRPELAEAWYALEAHFSAHLGESPEAIRTTLRLLQEDTGGSENGQTAKQQDALRYYRLCQRLRGQGIPQEASRICAWLRLLHAQLTWHRPENTPGQYKVVPNSVVVNPLAQRTPPDQVEATLARVFGEHYEQASPGLLRAALVYFVIADVHPFPDGNGRLGRWLMNSELQAAGMAPIVYPDSLKPAFGKALWAIRRERNFGPFATWLADCDAYTQELASQLFRSPC